MGYADVLVAPVDDGWPHGAPIQQYGAGYIALPQEPSTVVELHLVPHAGDWLPDEVLEAVAEKDLDDLARLIVDNMDAGTPYIANALVKEVTSTQSQAAVAWFGMSRLLIDANRSTEKEQLPEAPYVGSSALYADYQKQRGEQVRRTLLTPWISAVNDLVVRSDVRVLYHHHTYDVVSAGMHANDRMPGALRPPAQVFQRKPALGADRSGSDGVPLAPPSAVAALRLALQRWLRTAHRPDLVPVDTPLIAPALPYWGCTTDGPGWEHPVWHLLYEIRKDLLYGEESATEWLRELVTARGAIDASSATSPTRSASSHGGN